MTDLPDELYLLIFEFCDPLDLASPLQLVNRNWFRLIRSKEGRLLWCRMVLHNWKMHSHPALQEMCQEEKSILGTEFCDKIAEERVLQRVIREIIGTESEEAFFRMSKYSLTNFSHESFSYEKCENHWLHMFMERYLKDVKVEKLIMRLQDDVHTDHTALESLQLCIDMGLDVYEKLRNMSQMDDFDATESLTVKYYAQQALRKLHLGVVKMEMSKHIDALDQDDSNATLLRGLELICMSRNYLFDNVHQVEQPLRELELALKERLRARNLLDDPSSDLRESLSIVNQVLFDQFRFQGNVNDYYHPDNCFLDTTLATKKGIPITLSMIYILICQRVGIRAHPIAVPGHFLVATDPIGFSGHRLYIDPFAGGAIMTRQECIHKLQDMNIDTTDEQAIHTYLEPVPRGTDVYLRMLNNIMSFSRRHEAGNDYVVTMACDLALVVHPMHHTARIALAQLDLHSGNIESARQHIDFLRTNSQALVREYGQHVISHMLDAFESNIVEAERKRRSHMKRPEQRPRGGADTTRIKYYVGQTMTHRQYGYQGVIRGWEPRCNMSEEWIRQMGVDNLTQGRSQPFYQVLVHSEHGSRQETFVAQENISIMDRTMSKRLLHSEIGKYFTRYDTQYGVYVPNETMRWKYPHDAAYVDNVLTGEHSLLCPINED